jgi:hypothetical protein
MEETPMPMAAALLLAFVQPAAAPPQAAAAARAPAATPARPAWAGEIDVDVGRFDPADFPEIIRLERRMPDADMARRVEGMLADGRCQIAGATQTRFNIVVPFAILMQPDGTPETVVVHEAGCESLEVLVGQIVVAQIRRGDFRPQHREGERWYVSEIGFALGVQSEAVAIARDNPDRVICRAPQMVLGTRTRAVRTCRTAAEWLAFENDREQLRRDIGNSAKGVPNQ